MLHFEISLSTKALMAFLVFGLMTLFTSSENASAQVTLTLDAGELFDKTGGGGNPSPDNNDIDYDDVDAMGIADVNLRKLSGSCMDSCDGGGCSGDCGNSSDIWGEASPGAIFPGQEGAWFGCTTCPAPNPVRTETYQLDILEAGTNNLLQVDRVLLRFNGINNNIDGLEEFGNFRVVDNTGFEVTGSTNFMHTSIATNPAVPGACGGGTTFDPIAKDINGVFPSGCDDGAFLELEVTNGTLSSIRFTRSDINNIQVVSPPCCFNSSEGSYLVLVQLGIDDMIPPPTPTPGPTDPGSTPTPVPGPGAALLLAAIFMLHRKRGTRVK